ncbi:hypothetical protein SAMN05216338_101730 [Bradyrhizobium sp. Rc2d]|uniref:hypothetical protein n=1 Tax=Bradyrhizobium sp. Rc2d TaxID=1855321 RepID=UPI000880DCB9|nr:hypothetical protein [Bradyrhizobium sp. Rc2d]SDI08674.1 hypothetical protein SAMN05216338_101730 [Bradyrhizobium sp. Rc2d]
MIWKNFVNRLLITSRRKGPATALVYGLSLGIRFTSATREEVEIPAQSMQGTNPVISIMATAGAQLPQHDWSPSPAQLVTFRRDWRLPSTGCRAACEGPVPTSSMPNCLP